MNKMSLFTMCMMLYVLLSTVHALKKKQIPEEYHRFILLGLCALLLTSFEKLLKDYGVIGKHGSIGIILDITSIIFWVFIYYFSPVNFKSIFIYFILWDFLAFPASIMINSEKTGPLYSAGLLLGLIAYILMMIGLFKSVSFAIGQIKKSVSGGKST